MFSAIEMKRKGQIVLTLGLMLIFQSSSFARSTLIPVDSIMNSLTSVKDIRVIEYVGDSVMIYIDTASLDTFKMDCKWKKLNESAKEMQMARDSSYDSWEGTFPEIGETVIMVEYDYGRSRILFGRRSHIINGLYRFWNPSSIPFANTVFFVPDKMIYGPTTFCSEVNENVTEYYCSDGFMIMIYAFERKRKTYLEG
ncbi:MAG: hypothetical protein COA58_00650 [Bacteroidetes bacterium]|nr:MAG: hypothetical protein COA58_00650 [Bacteroidota bacterium]